MAYVTNNIHLRDIPATEISLTEIDNGNTLVLEFKNEGCGNVTLFIGRNQAEAINKKLSTILAVAE